MLDKNIQIIRRREKQNDEREIFICYLIHYLKTLDEENQEDMAKQKKTDDLGNCFERRKLKAIYPYQRKLILLKKKHRQNYQPTTY